MGREPIEMGKLAKGKVCEAKGRPGFGIFFDIFRKFTKGGGSGGKTLGSKVTLARTKDRNTRLSYEIRQKNSHILKNSKGIAYQKKDSLE